MAFNELVESYPASVLDTFVERSTSAICCFSSDWLLFKSSRFCRSCASSARWISALSHSFKSSCCRKMSAAWMPWRRRSSSREVVRDLWSGSTSYGLTSRASATDWIKGGTVEGSGIKGSLLAAVGSKGSDGAAVGCSCFCRSSWAVIDAACWRMSACRRCPSGALGASVGVCDARSGATDPLAPPPLGS